VVADIDPIGSAVATLRMAGGPPADTVIYLNGERRVLSFSAEANGFIEEPISAFSRGRPVVCDQYLGNLPPAIVHVARTPEGGAALFLARL